MQNPLYEPEYHEAEEIHAYYDDLLADPEPPEDLETMTTQTGALGFQKGYQAALKDIHTALNNGGEAAVWQWLMDNELAADGTTEQERLDEWQAKSEQEAEAAAERYFEEGPHGGYYAGSEEEARDRYLAGLTEQAYLETLPEEAAERYFEEGSHGEEQAAFKDLLDLRGVEGETHD